MQKELEQLQAAIEQWQKERPQNSTDMLRFLQEHNNVVQSYEAEKQILLADEKVYRYELLRVFLQQYHDFLAVVKESYQVALSEECDHDVWYLLSYDSDDYEGRTYWNCKCLQCGKREEHRPSYFRNKVIMGDCFFARAKRHEKPYDVIRAEYESLTSKYDDYYQTKELSEDLYNAKAPVKTLLKRYK